MDMHIRGVPDHVHQQLVARAAERGISLRAYVMELLTQHTDLPTLDEWLDEVAALPKVDLDSFSSVDAVHESRQEVDDHLWDVITGR